MTKTMGNEPNNTNNEIWKQTKESNVIYVSNMGNVASDGNFDYEVKNDKEGMVFKININGEKKKVYYKFPKLNEDKYLCVTVKDNYEKIHKLVAEYFCDGFSNNKVVHHINLDKYDNRAVNLQPMTEDDHNDLHKKLREQENKKGTN